MKKIITILTVALFLQLSARCSTIFVSVLDNQFIPSDFTINTGDTIVWSWRSGIHSTTSSDIPAGAISWDQQLGENSQSFKYITTVTGSYDYSSYMHESEIMTGHFTVVSATGISVVKQNTYRLRSNYVSDYLDFEQEGNVKSIMPVVRDLTGRIVKRFEGSTLQSTNQFFVGDLKSGVYIFQLVEGDKYASYRFIKY